VRQAKSPPRKRQGSLFYCLLPPAHSPGLRFDPSRATISGTLTMQQRPIKFRAWDRQEHRYEYRNDVLDYWLSHPERYVIEQFTGLLDKNGKEIWEGDIVRIPGWKPGEYQIVFIEGAFCLGAIKKDEQFNVGQFVADIHYIQSGGEGPRAEVIGNLHENPELLKVEQTKSAL
jgi:uncharacterized phage protein (TIGR01671 family)